MKILCVIDSLAPGGAQRQLVELGIGLKKRGHCVSFLLYHNNFFYKNHLEESEITITCVKESSYWKRFVRMRRFIRNGNFNCVISFLEAANFITELSGFPYRNWKLIVGERSANPNIYKSAKLRLFRLCHVLADYVVANSQANIQIVHDLNPILPKSKCRVIYNAIDFEKWIPSLDYVPLRDKKFRIVVPARHQHLKNFLGLINAVSLLPERSKKHLKIDWFGKGITPPYYDDSYVNGRKRIKELKLDKVFNIYPESDQIMSEMQKADAIGLFSFYEGFPNVICEGMALQKPVICSNISDVPLFIDKRFIFDPHDPHSIATVIERLLVLTPLELIEIGRRNRDRALREFSINKVVDNYLHLLDS